MTAALDSGRPFTGSERQLLENTLELNRTELVRAVEHLTDTQAREKLVPSLTTPISLIKHCAAAERIWFHAGCGFYGAAGLTASPTIRPFITA
jgi:hypothetical protein